MHCESPRLASLPTALHVHLSYACASRVMCSDA
jgi:hypothetical protein